MNAAHPADLALVHRALAGDEEAQEELARRLGCAGRMIAARNRSFGGVLADDELEDVVQNTIARVWAKLGDYSGIAAIESWVYVFCEGELRNAVRAKRRRGARQVAIDGTAAFDTVDANEPTPPESAEDVAFCVEALAPSAQQIVRWKHFEDLSLEEINTRMDSKLNTTKSRYYRVLMQLRRCLEKRAKAGGQ